MQVVVPLQGTEDIRAADTVGDAHGYVVYALQAKESVAFKPKAKFTPQPVEQGSLRSASKDVQRPLNPNFPPEEPHVANRFLLDVGRIPVGRQRRTVESDGPCFVGPRPSGFCQRSQMVAPP